MLDLFIFRTKPLAKRNETVLRYLTWQVMHYHFELSITSIWKNLFIVIVFFWWSFNNFLLYICNTTLVLVRIPIELLTLSRAVPNFGTSTTLEFRGFCFTLCTKLNGLTGCDCCGCCNGCNKCPWSCIHDLSGIHLHSAHGFIDHDWCYLYTWWI